MNTVEGKYFGLDCKVIDNTQPTWTKIELQGKKTWVPKETVVIPKSNLKTEAA